MTVVAESLWSTGGITVNYASSVSDRTPLVLFHGFMDRWQAFLPIIPTLAERWQIFAPDMRGHGETDRSPDGVYRISDLVDDAAAFVDEVVGEPSVLFGHSAGAFPAIGVAARLPHLISVVVVGDMLFDVAYLTRLTSRPESVAYHRAVRDIAGSPVTTILPVLTEMRPGLGRAAIQERAESLHRLDPRGVDYHAEGRFEDLIGDFDGDSLLGSIGAPVLLIQADPACGGVIPDVYVDRVRSLARQGHHARLDGVGHDLGLETQDTSQLLRVLVPFAAANQAPQP